jgi:hypothetical protein
VDPDDLSEEENLSEAEEDLSEEEEDLSEAEEDLSEEEDQPESSVHDDLLISQSFKFIMNVQLALILFLILFWLYEHPWYRPHLE